MTLLEQLFPWLAGISLFCFAMAVYHTFFEKSARAQQRVETQLNPLKNNNTPDKDSENTAEKSILRKNKPVISTKMLALQTKIAQANWLIQPHEFHLLTFGLTLLCGVVSWLVFQTIWITLLTLVVSFFIPQLVLNLKVMLRLAKAEEQFSGVLDSMVSCLKSGFGFNQAVNSITENYPDPWGTEFGKMGVETSMGIEQTIILDNLQKRIPNEDVSLFVTAMKIYSETGGNLVELLNNLSNTIRIRYKLLRKVRTLSSQGKLSAGIVIVVPLFIMLFMYFIIPEALMQFIKHPIGIIIMSIVSIWMSFGVSVLFKMVEIEV